MQQKAMRIEKESRSGLSGQIRINHDALELPRNGHITVDTP